MANQRWLVRTPISAVLLVARQQYDAMKATGYSEAEAQQRYTQAVHMFTTEFQKEQQIQQVSSWAWQVERRYPEATSTSTTIGFPTLQLQQQQTITKQWQQASTSSASTRQPTAEQLHHAALLETLKQMEQQGGAASNQTLAAYGSLSIASARESNRRALADCAPR